LPFSNRYFVSGPDFTSVYNTGEDAFLGHYALAYLAANGAGGVALFAYLGDFKQHVFAYG
jgi:hypothetical protein